MVTTRDSGTLVRQTASFCVILSQRMVFLVVAQSKISFKLYCLYYYSFEMSDYKDLPNFPAVPVDIMENGESYCPGYTEDSVGLYQNADHALPTQSIQLVPTNDTNLQFIMGDPNSMNIYFPPMDAGYEVANAGPMLAVEEGSSGSQESPTSTATKAIEKKQKNKNRAQKNRNKEKDYKEIVLNMLKEIEANTSKSVRNKVRVAEIKEELKKYDVEIRKLQGCKNMLHNELINMAMV